MSAKPIINPNPALQSYYGSLESRIGYQLMLGGARHFGYYERDNWLFAYPFNASLRAMEQKLFEALDLVRGCRVLDAGCGAGFVAVYMARHGLDVTAIDVVEHHVEKARRNVRRNGLQDRVSVDRMDYHHLETIADASHDGVYTMETLVHATDPAAVLAGFYRVLKPGGHIAMHEYDNKLADSNASSEVKAALRQVNKYSAMVTNDRATPGYYVQLLEAAGFENIVVTDISKNITPMLRVMFVVAIVPYLFIKLFNLEKYFINIFTGVHAYWSQDFWRYLQITARKPGAPIESGKTR